MTEERDDATEVSKAWVQKCIDYEHELVSDHGGHVGLRDKLAASEQRVKELEKRATEDSGIMALSGNQVAWLAGQLTMAQQEIYRLKAALHGGPGI